MSEEFTLNNPAPKKQKVVVVTEQTKTRQQVLFAGMKCLPGQQDLFLTDGREFARPSTNSDDPSA